jgi:hypothetical protein
VFSRHERQRHSGSPVRKNLFTIYIQSRSANLPTLQSRPAHPCPYTLPNQIGLQLGDRTYEREEQSAQGSAGINVLPTADKLNPQTVQLINDLKEILGTSRNPIKRRDQQD